MKKQHILRQVISSFIAFVMSVLLFILTMGACLSVTVFHRDFVLDTLEKAGFYDKTVNTVLDNMKALPGGVPAELFDDLIDANLVRKDIINSVTAAFSGDSAYRLDLQPLKDSLMARFTDYAANNGLAISEESKANLQTLVDTCADVYRDQVTIPFIDTFGQIRLMFSKGYTVGMVIIVLLCALLALFLMSIRRYKHRGVRFLVYSFSCAALMTAALPAFVLINRAYERIHLSPQYVYDSFVSLVSSSMYAMLIGAAILLLLALALLPVVRLLKKAEIRKEKAAKAKEEH